MTTLKKTLLATLAAAPMALQATTIDITPGSLAAILADTPAAELRELTLTGSADARDLLALAETEGIETLDMEALRIEAYETLRPVYLTYFSFPADEIPPFIFAGTEFRSVTLPSSLLAVGEGAFSASKIESVSLPATLPAIGASAFCDTKLKAVELPAALTAVPANCFARCEELKLVSGSLPALAEIGAAAFSGCSALSSLPSLSKVTAIGERAFAGTAVTELQLSSLSHPAPYALAGMDALQSVSVSSEACAEGLFMADAQLAEVRNCPAVLDSYYFAGCAAFNPSEISPEFSSIGDYALAGVDASSLTFSEGLSHVGKEILDGCDNLTFINIKALGTTVPETSPDAFASLDQSAIELVVNSEDIDFWKSVPVWKEFKIVPTASTVVVVQNEIASGIGLALEGDIATLSSSDELMAIAVATLDGRILLAAEPHAAVCSLSLAGLNGTPLIITAASKSETRSFKIIF